MVAELTKLLEQNLLLVVLVLTRLSTLLMNLPAIGVGVPMKIRALLALSLTLLMVPTVAAINPNHAPQAAHLIDLSIMIAREALIGLLIGATIQILITGVQTAGEIMSGTGGLQLGDSVDPSTRSTMPTLAQLIGLLVVATLVSIGGHRYILGSLIDSFVALPAGDVSFHKPMLELLITQLASSLGTGIRVAAPVIAAMLLSNLITGLISRTLPQLNVLAIGLSLNAIALLAVATLTIGSASYLFRNDFSITLDRLATLWSIEP
jgi:flagellar biosynthetic protein FliR